MFSSCATSGLNLEVLQAADILVADDIKTLALVNRYRPAKKKKVLNVLEGLVTGEGIGQDRRAADEALTGLTDALAGSPRFSITRPNVELEGSGLGTFPEPLSPEFVKEITAENGAQALVTIEAFDSDMNTSCTSRTETIKEDGVERQVTVFEAARSVDVTVGWRFYDGVTGELIDEFRMGDNVCFNADGATEREAIRSLPNDEYVVREIGRVTGLHYSQRISPTWVTVHRRYYTKGSDNLRAGAIQMENGRIEKAEGWWKKDENHPEDKVQGRIAFNKALAAEMRGDLETAIDLAIEADRLGVRKGRGYAAELRYRIDEAVRLDAQMRGAEK